MGKSPFLRGSDEATHSAVTSGTPDLSGDQFSSLPPSCQEFITTCLTKNPRRRPTALQCQRHQWLLGGQGKGQGSPQEKQRVVPGGEAKPKDKHPEDKHPDSSSPSSTSPLSQSSDHSHS